VYEKVMQVGKVGAKEIEEITEIQHVTEWLQALVILKIAVH
jgi:hypothetical protein